MPWPRRIYPREHVRERRIKTDKLRKSGFSWRQIAHKLGHRSPQHARLDWLRWKDSQNVRFSC